MLSSIRATYIYILVKTIIKIAKWHLYNRFKEKLVKFSNKYALKHQFTLKKKKFLDQVQPIMF